MIKIPDPNYNGCCGCSMIEIPIIHGELMEACRQGDSETIARILSTHPIDIGMHKNMLSRRVAASGDIPSIKLLLQHGATTEGMMCVTLHRAYPERCFSSQCGAPGKRGKAGWIKCSKNCLQYEHKLYCNAQCRKLNKEPPYKEEISQKYLNVVKFLLTIPLTLNDDDKRAIKMSKDESVLAHLQ